MDLIEVRARLHMLSRLNKTPALSILAAADRREDWRKNPIQIGPGWAPLLIGMVERLLALPPREQPHFRFFRMMDGALDLSWFNGDIWADAICVETIAHAAHLCVWCGARGRPHRRRQTELVLCRTHGKLFRERPLAEIMPAERSARGEPFPRRKMLIDIVAGKQTESGFGAALANIDGEHGYEPAHLHLPAAWLRGTTAEADLYVFDPDKVGLTMDHAIFGLLGQRRDFPLLDAKPVIQAAAVAAERIAEAELMIKDASHDDPEVRRPAFQELTRLFRAVADRDGG
jgi:hypothetical protein